jgi:hypothetical protein
VLYIIFPAAPPRLYFASLGLFKVTLKGGPITQFQDALFAMMPNHADRAAFRACTSAVSLLSLYYAWKYCQWFFPVLLVFDVRVAGFNRVSAAPLVVDLIAGSLLVPWTLWLTPRFERWWGDARYSGNRFRRPSGSPRHDRQSTDANVDDGHGEVSDRAMCARTTSAFIIARGSGGTR